MGQLPLLEVDGKVYNQSVSILRFLGNEFGLAGKTNAENIAIDIIADTITDLKNGRLFYISFNETLSNGLVLLHVQLY